LFRFSVLGGLLIDMLMLQMNLLLQFGRCSILIVKRATIKEQEGVNFSDKERDRMNSFVWLLWQRETKLSRTEPKQTKCSKHRVKEKDDVNHREDVSPMEKRCTRGTPVLMIFYLPVNEDTDAFEKTQIKPTQAEVRVVLGSGYAEIPLSQH
jgi:hypothetical protein